MQRTYVDQFGRIITEQITFGEIVIPILVVFAVCLVCTAITILLTQSITNKPKELYEYTNMNMVSCWIISILYYINPVVLLAAGIYFITHVGRKDD